MEKAEQLIRVHINTLPNKTGTIALTYDVPGGNGGTGAIQIYDDNSNSYNTRVSTIPGITSYDQLVNKPIKLQNKAFGLLLGYSSYTLNVNGLGAKSLYFMIGSRFTNNTSNLGLNHFITGGVSNNGEGYYDVMYDGTRFICLYHLASLADQYNSGLLSSELYTKLVNLNATGTESLKLYEGYSCVGNVVYYNNYWDPYICNDGIIISIMLQGNYGIYATTLFVPQILVGSGIPIYANLPKSRYDSINGYNQAPYGELNFNLILYVDTYCTYIISSDENTVNGYGIFCNIQAI